MTAAADNKNDLQTSSLPSDGARGAPPCIVDERLVRETGIGRAGVSALAAQVRANLHTSIVLVRKGSANLTAADEESIKVLALAFVAAAKAEMV